MTYFSNNAVRPNFTFYPGSLSLFSPWNLFNFEILFFVRLMVEQAEAGSMKLKKYYSNHNT